MPNRNHINAKRRTNAASWGVIGVLLWLAACRPASGALPQEVYVWQRSWTEPVRRSVLEHAASFSNVVFLAAEVSWKNGRMAVERFNPPPNVLSQIHTSFGLAFRVGHYTGEFLEDDSTARRLAALAASLKEGLGSNAPRCAEIQIDFDSAASQLAGYAKWVGAVKKAVAPMPLSITALPSWLNEPGFPALADAADGYVLQVHSLERPKTFDDPFTLCDPAAAKTAVARASQIGRPFRVALPTYGYLLAFAPDGRFVGLSAEGPAKHWPANAKVREVRADAAVIFPLVREWSEQPPAGLRGIIWYRLPMTGDILNWRWPTLDAMLQLRPPREHVRAAARRIEPGLLEISLENDGGLDLSSRPAVTVHWQGARMLSGDALRGFELAEKGPQSLEFQTASPPRLRAGETWTIGWIRLDHDTEVTLETKNP